MSKQRKLKKKHRTPRQIVREEMLKRIAISDKYEQSRILKTEDPIEGELNTEQRRKILNVANTNLLCGIIEALNAQLDYLSSREFEGQQKYEFTKLRNASNACVRSWNTESKDAVKESTMISTEILDIIYTMRAKMVKRYTDFALGKAITINK